jgi:hypothetical protein
MKTSSTALFALALLGLLGERARAQGADDCSAATTISGTGTFNVTTVGSTDSPQQSGACVTAHHDVWFKWTASATQSMAVSTCGTVGADTVIAVYGGTTCPSSGSEIACNDDSCGQQSSLFFSATNGATYLIQIGAWATATTFIGSFTVAPGANPCGSNAGPDVIVGDITDLQNVSAAGGLDAFTVGTTSCNIGTTILNWQGNNPLHPVIAEALYRYKIVNGAGRMEQVGIGWLKHGFASDTGSLCCTCQPPINNQIMGVGCSDPYVASQAGAQNGLTPRWQVNPHTGVFPYPGANPFWAGSTARRTEVALTDLEVSGGTTHYYIEATYVTQDDAQAGNNNNNESYKEILVSGGPSNFAFATAGFIHRMTQAIRAWGDVEPGVTLTDVQVPGDGLFIVGSHATSLGGGVWHYEFAVHNMNSDRAGGSFSVAVPAGANVTNIGFHDVTYRNGDGQLNIDQTGTDWPATVAGGSISWACETQAANPNANAIRWQTIYNFRFDANVAPQSGNVTLGLWKSGSPAAMSAAAEVPGGGTTTFAYCFGDGSGSACPCGNESAVGANAGCLNSLGTGGKLASTGTPSVGGDTFVLQGTDMPNGAALYFQGTTQIAGGAGALFGDGLRCAGGTVIRLAAKANTLGASQYPAAGDMPASVIGGDVAGDVRTYQCWYRNAIAFCQTETYNLTNGLQTTWQP